MHTTAEPFDRVPPHSIPAEMCLLGSMAIDARARADALLAVRREDLYQADHQIIFGVLADMHRGGVPVDSVSLREEMIRRRLFDEVGGMPYLAAILNSVPSSAHAAHYASIVRDKATLRRLIEVSNQTLRDAYGPDADGQRLGQELLDRAAALHVSDGVDTGAMLLEDALHEVYEEATGDGVPMHALPFDFLNDMLGGGVADGEFVIVAGWPSHGKSALCKQFGEHLAGKGKTGGIVTLEESRKKIARNLLSAESGVDNKVIRRGKVGQADGTKMAEAISRLARHRIFIHERATTLGQVTAAVDIGVAKQGWKWAVIDHLDLVDVTSIEAKSETAQHTRLSGTIKNLAKRLNIPVFAVKQLKKPDGNEMRQPRPADLRQSGAYFADCDVLILVNSNDVHHRGDTHWQKTGETECIVAKAREGTGGCRKLRWDGATQRYYEIAHQYRDGPHVPNVPTYDPF